MLICADAWYPEPYRVIAAQEADLLVVPSYSPGDGHWSAPWAGYDGAPPPPDVDPQDVGRLTEGQAWIKYAMADRLPRTGIRAGINVFLRGRLWDLGADGHTTLSWRDQVIEAPDVDGAALVNAWL